MQYLIAFCSRPEAASDVISSHFVELIVSDEFVKFGDPCLNRFGEIRPEAIEGGIFDIFRDNIRPEVVIQFGCKVGWYGCPYKIW